MINHNNTCSSNVTLVCDDDMIIHDNTCSSNVTLVSDEDIQNQVQKLVEKHIKLSKT